MKKLLTALMVVGILVAPASLMADAIKGQKYFTKKLKSSCGISGAALAGKHTQEDWKEVNEAGKLKDEIKAICPNVKDSALKDKYMQHYYDFLFEYASDSGNVPAC